jgi:hypothetical protein
MKAEIGGNTLRLLLMGALQSIEVFLFGLVIANFR